MNKISDGSFSFVTVAVLTALVVRSSNFVPAPSKDIQKWYQLVKGGWHRSEERGRVYVHSSAALVVEIIIIDV